MMSLDELTSKSGYNDCSVLMYCTVAVRETYVKSGENACSVSRYCTVVMKGTYIKVWVKMFAASVGIVLLSSPKLCTISYLVARTVSSSLHRNANFHKFQPFPERLSVEIAPTMYQ